MNSDYDLNRNSDQDRADYLADLKAQAIAQKRANLELQIEVLTEGGNPDNDAYIARLKAQLAAL